jgi:tRNA(His) guanylyltransferase
MNKLKTRIVSYQDATDYKLLNRLPIIISINGRNFNKITSLIKKPYDEVLAECLLSIALKLCSEIDGALFSFQHNDEIVIAIRNDQSIDITSYYDNRIQKICSATASIATSHFIKCVNKTNLNLIGDANVLSFNTIFLN